MAEFRVGLQTRQEERYVFWLLLGGSFNIRRRSLALAGPPISVENRGGGCAYSGPCVYSKEYGIYPFMYVVPKIVQTILILFFSQEHILENT